MLYQQKKDLMSKLDMQCCESEGVTSSANESEFLIVQLMSNCGLNKVANFIEITL